MTRERLTALSARTALLVGLVMAGLTLRAWVSCSEELELAREARDAGSLESAIDHYRRAAVWYFPGNVRSRDALEALLEIGHDAQERGDATLALAAYRSVHGASMSTRHLLVPGDDLRALADEEIATLMADGTVPPLDANRSRDERRRLYLEMLRADRDVRLGWTLLALAGFAIWVGSAAAFLGRTLDETGAVIAREARRWGTGFVLGLGLFVLGLALA